jgi:signal transduction histidine kinase
VDRRVRSRRGADRVAHEETRLLARSLDILAADLPAEARLAGVLDLLARTVGAARAAVVADEPTRRVAVAAAGPSDEPAARALGTWLDDAARRSRAERAAAGQATVLIAMRARPSGHDAAPVRDARPAEHFAAVPIASARGVTLGFAFTRPTHSAVLHERLPANLARHAAVVLSLVTESMTVERDLRGLRASEAERGRFVSIAAHELRTPLTGLSGYLDLILDGQAEDPEIQREFLERSRAIVGSMTALVGDLLETSRLESGSLDLVVEPFSIADALGDVAKSLLPIALDGRVRIETSLPPRMRTALGDRRRVDQIVTNLAANALKYAADGGVVELAGRFDGTDAIIAVRDEGAGIDAEDHGRIFEPFYRIADHRRITGTGLGLSIARDLARAMGGDLDLASLPGTGSSFVLVLPGPTGSSGDALGAALADAVSFETDRLEALAAVRSAERSRPAVRHVALGLRSSGSLEAGARS